MYLYHTGFEEIKVPDIHVGRKNADFGQGFYLSTDLDFSRRWARIRKDRSTYINSYELDLENIKVLKFERDAKWYEYINNNRNNKTDIYADYDVIIGPIAIDTIYDMYGITTSGFISADDALKILSIGPVYTQVTLKTENAVKALKFLSSEIVDSEIVSSYRALVAKEEDEFQKEFAKVMEEIN
ncbi:MAG: DUF3990 domain-containing protein [Butyrivibrio sp.]|uniref:DUF3990 domain-containing protein n=1 Tax=Butyrivibrio sp. TaxID=28121 RepID=UPI0025EBB275|nr:DUF3990 domain-containing protein [Butyrivibrio sp.]MCR5770379.1 DUF3990 domain-containing protein [Butyrivibrio sp.]